MEGFDTLDLAFQAPTSSGKNTCYHHHGGEDCWQRWQALYLWSVESSACVYEWLHCIRHGQTLCLGWVYSECFGHQKKKFCYWTFMRFFFFTFFVCVTVELKRREKKTYITNIWYFAADEKSCCFWKGGGKKKLMGLSVSMLIVERRGNNSVNNVQYCLL